MRRLKKLWPIICLPAVWAMWGENPTLCMALEPGEVTVVVNEKVPESLSLAKYYMKQRRIPPENLIRLRVTDDEACSRETYEKEIALPVRRYFGSLCPGWRIRCLVMMYGIPLKIRPGAMTRKQRELENELEQLRESASGNRPERLEKKLARVRQQNDRQAAVDSEIALVLKQAYPLGGWIPNPYFIGFGNRKMRFGRADVVMVSRLDGPSGEIVRRVIDDSIAAEKEGLRGTAYFDARWPKVEGNKKLSGYRLYDQSIHLAAERVEKARLMPVITEDTGRLFQAGEAPGAALYCGWYSLGRYIDAFDWQRGAIGYHIASSECETLKRKGSRVWCKRMLEDGIAATIGPVGEPYVSAFPVPEMFFTLLIRENITLAESYFLSTPFLSWKMVLIGDPLYRPFTGKGIAPGSAE